MTTPNLATALETSDELFDRETLQDAIKEMAVLINHDYEERDRPVFLSVMHGGMIFASLLSLELDFDVEVDYLHATRYRGAMSGSGLAWLHRPATPLEGRYVLIADDILDEGHTLKAVKQWCEDQGAIEVRIAVLAVPDRYVYGFGMDYHEQGRNLPGLYALGN